MHTTHYRSQPIPISDAHSKGPSSLPMPLYSQRGADGLLTINASAVGSPVGPQPVIPPLMHQVAVDKHAHIMPGSYALRQSSPQVTAIMGELAMLKKSIFQSLNGELTTEEYNSIYQHLSQLLASLPPPVEPSAAQPQLRLPSISQIMPGTEPQEVQRTFIIASSESQQGQPYISPPLSSTMSTHPLSPGMSVAKPNYSVSTKKNVCKVCGRECRRPSTLKTHMLTHTGQRPFSCRHPGCSKSFNVRSNMLRHERLHSRGSELVDTHSQNSSPQGQQAG
ncbi:ADR308Cp [Eremothecium gossypii ATCC 10895]|uniref:ADR308Cp n=1 Tax=Eremothecium gossypii (strain ATCC 10895 / CBS 109.51 / FGSC 9923 / NRRL Y-1056) TaxID=284811 RepID=Q759G8_EREGS|nr:ADR308Cp [Eremothecium gossypii ATCC 10895]AAS52228.1 ADR308Cp [Eremothecium gossypii ATCC 10895]AEY96527.1 FADR308Cp [Eremothecium gossypii FDAG1]